MARFILSAIAFLLILSGSSQVLARDMVEVIDVKSYHINLDLSNFTKHIVGKTRISFVMKVPSKNISFDFHSPNKPKEGMRVTNAFMGEPISWKHEDHKILLSKDTEFEKGQEYQLIIEYQGLPVDGLIISKNQHKDHTAFGDNWPNRAHHWFPCTDHPADKATVEFVATYPKKYRLVANGNLISDSVQSRNTRHCHWKSSTVLPTKVMVIGLAEFAVSDPCITHGIEVNSWVFNQQQQDGFHDYAPACNILSWYIEKLGSYPFEKLANVQSKTRYGGMENASCIFYYEASVNGEQGVNNLIAHEIAHQWFGNSVSEMDWEHIWLSEGFATYLTNLYILEHDGKEAFKAQMLRDREKVLGFHKRYKAPVVDTLVPDLNMLLNPNSYQKGAWVLHMLRQEVGDSTFWQGLRVYYEWNKLGNATTNDFKEAMERVSGKDLTAFFQQWLYTQGHPLLKVNWKKKKDGTVEIELIQQQEELFQIEVAIVLKGEEFENGKLVRVEKRKTTVSIEAPGENFVVNIDPEVNLMFELDGSSEKK